MVLNTKLIWRWYLHTVNTEMRNRNFQVLMFAPSMTMNKIYNVCAFLSQSLRCNSNKKGSFLDKDSMKVLHFQERILEPWVGLYYYFHFYLNHSIVCLSSLNHTHYTVRLNLNNYLIPKSFRIRALLFIKLLKNN